MVSFNTIDFTKIRTKALRREHLFVAYRMHAKKYIVCCFKTSLERLKFLEGAKHDYTKLEAYTNITH